MKAEDLKTKTEDELKKELFEQRKKQFNLRFQRTNGTLENTSELRKTRRTIARIKTFLSNPTAKAAAAKKPKAVPKKTTDKKKAEKAA